MVFLFKLFYDQFLGRNAMNAETSFNLTSGVGKG